MRSVIKQYGEINVDVNQLWRGIFLAIIPGKYSHNFSICVQESQLSNVNNNKMVLSNNLNASMICFRCGHKGHMRNKCRTKAENFKKQPNKNATDATESSSNSTSANIKSSHQQLNKHAIFNSCTCTLKTINSLTVHLRFYYIQITMNMIKSGFMHL